MTTADEGTAGGPTVLRMLLGAHLRRLREARGVTRDAAGWEIRASESKISRMELGRVGFKERDVADLLSLYGIVDEEERGGLLDMARNSNRPGWWHRDGDILASWFQSYLGLEASASLIRSYEVQFIPGLLQTADYARAVIMLGHDNAPEDEVERRVALRMKRQEILERKASPLFWVVIDEGVLRRPVGGIAVMRAQIEALISAARRPSVRIQIVPFRVGGHAAAGGSFSILRFPEQDLPDVVYVEQLISAIYFDKRDDVDQYAVAMERLCVEADQPERTVATLESILRELEKQDD